MTALRPGTSPPPVRMPMRFFAITTPLAARDLKRTIPQTSGYPRTGHLIILLSPAARRRRTFLIPVRGRWWDQRWDAETTHGRHGGFVLPVPAGRRSGRQ